MLPDSLSATNLDACKHFKCLRACCTRSPYIDCFDCGNPFWIVLCLHEERERGREEQCQSHDEQLLWAVHNRGTIRAFVPMKATGALLPCHFNCCSV